MERTPSAALLGMALTLAAIGAAATLPVDALASPAAIRSATQPICTQPVVLEEVKVVSEISAAGAIETEVANECSIPAEGRIVKVTWWGGWVDGVPPGEPTLDFNLRFYEDAGCQPGALIQEYLNVTPTSVAVGTDGLGYPTYRYEMVVDFSFGPGVLWTAPQAIIDFYPPQHGRQGNGGDLAKLLCDSAYRNPSGGYPEWTPVAAVIGRSWEASQEIEFVAGPTPIAPSRWGLLKNLFR